MLGGTSPVHEFLVVYIKYLLVNASVCIEAGDCRKARTAKRQPSAVVMIELEAGSGDN